MKNYPYAVYEFQNDKTVAVAHNLFYEEAEEELKGNINQRDFRHQAREHLAEDADHCSECTEAIAQEYEDEEIPGAFGTHQVHDIG